MLMMVVLVMIFAVDDGDDDVGGDGDGDGDVGGDGDDDDDVGGDGDDDVGGETSANVGYHSHIDISVDCICTTKFNKKR